MRRVGMSRDEILAALVRANADRCSPPLPAAEVERIAASVARYEPDQVSVALAEDHWSQDFAPPPAGYVLLGAAAGVEFLAPTGEVFRLSVVGTNLLNARYRDYTSLLRYFADEPGWGVQLRFSADFDVALKKSRS